MLYTKKNHRETKEYQLLNDFLKMNFFSKYIDNEELHCTLIQEPYTGLGYPDLVAVIWDSTILNKWKEDRNKLTINDIKILHHLYLNKKYKTILEVTIELGFSEKEVSKSISQLFSSGLIKFNKSNKFKALQKSEIFFIQEIISVEAKLKDWRRAFDQAYINSFFASKSYILFPEKSVTEQMLNIYKNSGIGILAYEKNINIMKEARKMAIPASLNSWLFNEYIGRTFEWQ